MRKASICVHAAAFLRYADLARGGSIWAAGASLIHARVVAFCPDLRPDASDDRKTLCCRECRASCHAISIEEDHDCRAHLHAAVERTCRI